MDRETDDIAHQPADADTQRYAREASECCQLMLDRAMEVLSSLETWQCQESAERESLSAILLHMIEMADAVDVLLNAGACMPAWLQVRSMFEGLLSIEYLAENETALRSLSWQFFHVAERVRQAEKHDLSTARGKEWAKAVAHDELGPRLSAPPRGIVQQDLAALRAELRAPRFEAVRELMEKDR
ncbi:MAG: DUF5677 domain-containing protein, partial [Candidatus Bipolaricaulis sp.]|nr:DUF5677 domain-containing protein [Candidatus Bipolaricaulis sp.]